MNKFPNTAIACLALLWAAGAAAQPFDRVERRNFWNAGHNITGLRTDSLTISYAEAYARGENGGFRDFSEASEAWSAGAVANTITHLEKVSMAGSFSFDHTSGRGMGGSMFIHPGFYPVDLIEFTPGRKDLQTYAFTGGIAADIAPRWRIGAKIDFTSQNYAKRRDLRHSNYRLDMTVAPGVMYYTGSLALGAAYIFSKNAERVSAEQVSDKGQYYAFLDKGLMYGASELWTGSGIHLSETGVTGFPVTETLHGIALQAQWKGFHADIEYQHSAGKAGEKQAIWFRFPAHRITARAAYRFGTGERLHFLRLTVGWQQQANDETVMEQTTSNGITTTTVYGSNRIFERDALSINPEYEWTSPRGEFRGGAEVETLDRLSSQMYPYLYSQSIIRWRVYASGMVRAGRFDLRAGAAFATGHRTEKSRIVDSDIDAGTYPTQLTDQYDLQNEYLTAARTTVGLSVRYNTRWGLYAEAGASLTHGFDLHCIDGSNRWCETLKIGYTF